MLTFMQGHRGEKELYALYLVQSVFKGNNLKGGNILLTLALYSDIYRLFSFKLGMIVERT